MQYSWIVASIAGVVLYFVLQSIDDRRNDQRHLPRANTAKRGMMFLFVMLICQVLVYLLSKSTSEKTLDLGAAPVPKVVAETSAIPSQIIDPSTSNALQTQMLRAIKEDVIVGRPPF